MTAQIITLERREETREGIISEIEDVAYSVLRKYGIDSPTDQRSFRGQEEKSA